VKKVRALAPEGTGPEEHEFTACEKLDFEEMKKIDSRHNAEARRDAAKRQPSPEGLGDG
jgi:hypothetical protein